MGKNGLTEKEYAVWICNIQGIDAGKIENLLEYFGSLEDIFHAKRCQLEQVRTLQPKDIERILLLENKERIQTTCEKMVKRGISFVYREEADFPERLIHMDGAPYGIFYKGKLPDPGIPSVAVVGARKVSEAGKQIADKFGYELAANGIQVVSGMALGVDILAQRGALKAPMGQTYAVLGTGVDICYPKSHIESYMQIQEHGGILSEFPFGTPALPYHFPIRNRIISGLSDGVLIVEAKKGSGSLITAEYALEQGREIFVVPGAAFDPQYEGSNELLKSGAVLVTDIKDILDGLGIFVDEDTVSRKKKTNIMLETTEKMVYAILRLEPVHLSELMEETGIEPHQLMEILFSLQEKKLVKMVGNNYFMICI